MKDYAAWSLLKSKSTVKRVLSVVLAGVLAASLWGCASKNTGEAKDPSNGPSANGSSEDDNGTGKEPAMGRYIETRLSMPQGIENEWVNEITQTPDGQFELYSQTKDEPLISNIYRFDGTSWKKEEDPWVSRLPEKGGVHSVRYDKDGTIICTYYDGDYQFHLARVLADKTIEDIPVKELEGERTNRIWIADDGVIFLPLMGERTLVLDQTGALLFDIPQRFSWSDYTDSQTLTADSYITVGDRGFMRYGLDGGEKETIPYQSGEADINGSLTAGAGNDFYLCNSQGIHHMAENGTIWETVVDGTLNSLGMPSTNVKRLFLGDDNDYYVWLKENEENILAHYTYDGNTPSVPSKTLTVYGLDLSENETVRQAASLFQMEHTDVRVEVIDGQNGLGGAATSDTIRALNTELLNGTGADVLILDGLPVNSYIEKGILADMMETVVGPMVSSGELYENIVREFVTENDAVYQIPSRVAWPITYGDQEAMDSLKSLDEIRRYQLENPAKTLVDKNMTYENILWQYLRLYYLELVGDRKGELKQEAVQSLLETVKEVGDAAGAKIQYEAEDLENPDMLDTYNQINKAGFRVTTHGGVLAGTTAAGVELPTGMFDYAMPFAVLKRLNEEGNPSKLQSIHGIYYPKGLLGVTSQSREKDTAMEFVNFVLSEAVQGSDLSDGFPVNRKGTQVWMNRELPYLVSIGSPITGFHLDGKYPEAEERKMVLDQLPILSTPVMADSVIMEMIVNETRGYFEGTQTSFEAAAQAAKKAQLYEAE